MEKERYKRIVDKYTPKEDRLKNALISFFVGGIMGLIGQALVDIYSYCFNML